jgi:NADPH-dependent 2,4-dienoyl-CoA reductase/sulfur reductase-like enzyme
MSEHDIVIVGAGPAGMRAAMTLADAGLRSCVIDEAPRSGGQIYRRPPPPLGREPKRLYGFEAHRAVSLHAGFDAINDRVDHCAETLVWTIEPGCLGVVRRGRPMSIPWRCLILCPGAMDRVIPFPGWTLPGVYTLGGAQIALKYQGCFIGRRIVLVGTGPLLYLLAWQYAKAGASIAAILDTAPSGGRVKALPGLLRGGRTLLKGIYYVGALRARGIAMASGVRPVAAIAGDDGAVAALLWCDRLGREHRLECDAVALGFGLRSETQLADLCGAAFAFDTPQRQWLPVEDGEGRSSVAGVYLAGDGARVRGADDAEITGERAACAFLVDIGRSEYATRLRALNRILDRSQTFRRALDGTAFPFPVDLARRAADDLMVCRCEGITAGALRKSVRDEGARELNRVKAFTRLGMGRCQGRVCAAAAAEIVADTLGVSIEAIGRLRGQPPVKPVALGVLARSDAAE